MRVLFGSVCLIVFGAFIAVGNAANRTSHVIPLSYFRSSGLLDAMKDKQKYVEFLKNQSKLNGHQSNKTLADVERTAQRTVGNVGCDPYEQIVALENNRPDVVLQPSCIFVKQCGGCCGHPALQCRPTLTQTKSVPVEKFIYKGAHVEQQNKTEIINVEEHLNCACLCRTQETDCNLTIHNYDNYTCQCKCKAEQQVCAAHKRWDENVCACTCADVRKCGPEHFYNRTSCECEPSERSGLLRVGLANGRENLDTTTSNPCKHLSCPRRYEAKYTNGRCDCKYVRRRG